MIQNSTFNLTLPGPIVCISSSEDGRKIAAADRNGTLSLSGREGEQSWEKDVDEGIHGLAIIGNGSKVVCGGKDCKVKMFNSLGNIEWEQTIGKSIWSMDVDTSGQFIAIGTGDSIALFTEGGLQLWEYPTNRAMVGVGISRNGTTIVGCGDEFLYCLDNDGNLMWEKQRSDSLWDVSTVKEGELIFIGGWDCRIHCLDRNGNDSWNFETGGYVRSVMPMEDGGVLAGSHDGFLYRLSDSGKLLERFETGEEITCVAASKQTNLVVAGFGNQVKGFEINPSAAPVTEERIPDGLTTEEPPTEIINEESKEEFEPMFGVGMFDEPIPDSIGISSSSASSTPSPSTTSNSYYNQTDTPAKGGEFGKFASEVIKSDVKNYLRLGNAAWAEKRLERAEEHYKRATEVDPEEPRAWHNLAICNYHLALKRNPENVKGAVQSAFALLEVAREKGGREYTAPNETLKYFASQLGLIEETD
tara:strand:+ start:1402 stop:2820 length:1419 start_codon:yes stop_codon:yes gene_type:complete